MINKLAQRALECAQKRGKVNPYHPIDVMESMQKKAVHDEAVELLVARTNRISEHLPQYTEDVEEAADVVISALTYLAMVAVDVQEVIEAKMKFNETREA